jgi:tetratricopeptide (TPR) repeat protein
LAGKLQGVITSCDVLLNLNPDNPNFLIEKANALVQIRKYEDAMWLYYQAIANDPDNRSL